MDIERLHDPDTWDRLVERAPETTPFHRYAALEVLADHSDTDLHPLVGYVGQEPAGLLPLFSKRFGPANAVFSPPPDLKIPYLGPALLADPNMKRRKRERRHCTFVESALASIDEELSPHYVTIRTDTTYTDPRPFVWNDFSATPRYTYHVDTTQETDTLLSQMGSDLRSNVRGTDPDAFEITAGDPPDMERIVRDAQRRHAEQDVFYGVEPDFVRDLARAIPDAIRAYVCTTEDRFAGGSILLDDGEQYYRWQSVSDFDAPVPAQDLLDWHVIQTAVDDGYEAYDLVGANDRRLSEYKAKFAPQVVPYYRLERSGPLISALAQLYTRIR